MLQTLKHHEHKITITSYLVKIIFKETEEVRELEHRNFYISHIFSNSFFRRVHFCDYTLSSRSWQLLWVHLRDSKDIYLKFSFPICQEKGKSVCCKCEWVLDKKYRKYTHTNTHSCTIHICIYTYNIYICIHIFMLWNKKTFTIKNLKI